MNTLQNYILEKLRINKDIEINNILTNKSIDANIDKILNLFNENDRKAFIDNLEDDKIYEASFLNDDQLDYSRDFSIKFKDSDFNQNDEECKELASNLGIEYIGWIDGGNGLNTIWFDRFDGKHVYLFILSYNLDVLNDYKEKLLKNGLKESDISIYDIIK